MGKPALAVMNGADQPLIRPRGPMMSAEKIVRDYFTDPDSGEAYVSAKWVRDTVPGKVRLSHNVVLWYRDDVLAWIASRQEKKR